jgi:hypothetical protein
VLPSQWANFQALGRLAKDRDTAGVLAHVSTDNVARDMLRIVEAHGETKLRYWGISYVYGFFRTFDIYLPRSCLGTELFLGPLSPPCSLYVISLV